MHVGLLENLSQQHLAEKQKMEINKSKRELKQS